MKAELLHMSHQEQSRSQIMRLYVEGYIFWCLQFWRLYNKENLTKKTFVSLCELMVNCEPASWRSKRGSPGGWRFKKYSLLGSLEIKRMGYFLMMMGSARRRLPFQPPLMGKKVSGLES